jgi:hypothetical protein
MTYNLGRREYLIDFGFEREVAIESGPKMLKSGIIVGDPDFQPPAKRTKSSIETEQSQQEEKKDASHSIEINNNHNNDKNFGKQSKIYWSAPPKVDTTHTTPTKLMSDAKKLIRRGVMLMMGKKSTFLTLLKILILIVTHLLRN